MKVLVCDHFTPESLALISNFEVQTAKSTQPSREELKWAEALLVRSRTRLDRTVLEQANRLKYIVTATSGFDHIDWPYCAEKKIEVAYTPDANPVSTAEHTFALMLAVIKKSVQANQAVKQNSWRTHLTRLPEIKGLELGILGLGRIGQRVARIAQAFEMVVSAYDPYQQTGVFEKLGVQPLGLIEVLMSSDIITLHLPLTKETRHIINHQTIPHINRDAYLINAARGALIDELELALAVEKGQFKGVALDVFEKEPLPKESRLLELPQVLLSPHVGAFTEDAFQRASQQAVQELISMTENRMSKNRLPLNTAWFDLCW